MSVAVRRLLDTFESLSDPEKLEAAEEILRRCAPFGEADPTDESLTAIADDLFRSLDAEEADGVER